MRVATVISIGGNCWVSGGIVAAAEDVLRSANETAERIVRGCRAEMEKQGYVGRIKVEDGIHLGDGSVSFHVNVALEQPAQQLDEEGFWRNVRIRLGLQETAANSATDGNSTGVRSAQLSSAAAIPNAGPAHERHQDGGDPLGPCPTEDGHSVVPSRSAPFRLDPRVVQTKEIDCATCALVYVATLKGGRILLVPFEPNPVEAGRPGPSELGGVISEGDVFPARVHIVRRYEIVRDEERG